MGDIDVLFDQSTFRFVPFDHVKRNSYGDVLQLVLYG